MHQGILDYNNKLNTSDKAICDTIANLINENQKEGGFGEIEVV